MQKIALQDLSCLSQTLLIPLTFRAVESKRPDPILHYRRGEPQI